MNLAYTPSQREFLIKVINRYFPDIEIFVFGSRASGTFIKTSDLDLCIKGKKKLDLPNWSKLEDEICQSDLPFKVDLLDWYRLPPELQKTIKEEGKVF